jgi:hypothetical protein
MRHVLFGMPDDGRSPDTHTSILKGTRRAEFVTDMEKIRKCAQIFRKILRYENFGSLGVHGKVLNLKLQ